MRVHGEKVDRRSMNCETLAPSPNPCFQGEMGFGRSPWMRTERAVPKTTTSGDWAWRAFKQAGDSVAAHSQKFLGISVEIGMYPA